MFDSIDSNNDGIWCNWNDFDASGIEIGAFGRILGEKRGGMGEDSAIKGAEF